MLELRRTLHPRGVLPVKLGGKVVSDEIMRGVLVFFLFYILTFAVCTAVVIACGADIVTGFTATIATLGNIGPGMGAVGLEVDGLVIPDNGRKDGPVLARVEDLQDEGLPVIGLGGEIAAEGRLRICHE